MNFIKYFYAFRHSFTKTLTLILKRKNHTPQKGFKKIKINLHNKKISLN
jgi:hypothetical protein